MTFAVVSGQTYKFSFDVLYRIGNAATNTTVGVALGLTFPAATVVSAYVDIPSGAAGATYWTSGPITASGGSLVTTSQQNPNTVLLAGVAGTITPSANGNIALMFGCELSTTAGPIILAGTNGRIFQIA